MNKRLLLILLCSLGLSVLISCDSNSSGPEEPESEIEVTTIENLEANKDGDAYTFFSFHTGQEIAQADSATTNWDIAFRGTSVLVNSGSSGPGEAGAVMLNVPFSQVEIAPLEGYVIDSEEEPAILGNGGWYTYTGHQGTPPLHAIIANEDMTLVLKSADGNHYIKLEIISYYLGNPDTSSEEFANTETRAESRYYTFRYAIQQIEGLRELN